MRSAFLAVVELLVPLIGPIILSSAGRGWRRRHREPAVAGSGVLACQRLDVADGWWYRHAWIPPASRSTLVGTALSRWLSPSTWNEIDLVLKRFCDHTLVRSANRPPSAPRVAAR